MCVVYHVVAYTVTKQQSLLQSGHSRRERMDSTVVRRILFNLEVYVNSYTDRDVRLESRFWDLDLRPVDLDLRLGLGLSIYGLETWTWHIRT